MRILWLSEGNSIVDPDFVHRLVERGYEVVFVSYTLAKVRDMNGIILIHRPIKFLAKNDFLARKLHFQGIRRRLIVKHLKNTIRKYKPDILHSGYLRFHGYYGELSGFHPHLSMPWGSDVLIQPNIYEYDKMMARRTLQNADAITCDCEVVKKKVMELSDCSGDKITVFPRGVDLKKNYPFKGLSLLRNKLGWQNNEVLIMNRAFEPNYGIEFFIDALPPIIKVRPNARVLLVGTGTLESLLKSKVKEFGLYDYVHFVGRVEHSRMAEYLNTADIYVTTSLSDGTSVSMLEAMACGLPVVVSDALSYFEWVKDGVNGYIVPRKNSKVLAERLIGLLNNVTLRKEMGQRNLQIARERADWERNIDILEGIYESLLKRKKSK